MENVRRIFLPVLALLASFFNLQGAPSLPNRVEKKGESFSVFHENGKAGLKDDQGQIVIPANHEAIGWSDGPFSVVGNVTGYKMNGLWGLINVANNKITKPEFTDLAPGEGLFIIARKKIHGKIKVQTGCINTSGKEVIPFQYDGLKIPASLRAIVFTRSGNKFSYGLIDFENKILIPLQYQNIYTLGSLRYGVENFEGKHAIFSEEGRQITGFDIDSLSAFRNNVAIMYQNRRQGLVDREGNIKLEATFREIRIGEDGKIETRLSDTWLFLKGENKLLREFQADSILVVGENRLKVNLAGKFQLTDKEFKPIQPLLLDRIGPLTNGVSIVKVGKRFGTIDADGKILIQSKYTKLILDGPFVRAEQFVDNKKLWVILDRSGNAKHTKLYDFIGNFNNGIFPVRHKGFWGVIDQHGIEKVACVHDSIIQKSNDRFVVKFKRNYGIIDINENWIVTPQPHPLYVINSERYLLSTPKTKFLKSLKNEVIYFTDNDVEINERYIVERLASGDRWKIGFDGLIISRMEMAEAMEAIFPEQEGLSAIKKDGRYGFIDDRGRLRIANRYEAVKSFNETLAAVKIRGKWGFINHGDQLAIQPVYDEVFEFNKGRCVVRQGNFYGIIDKSGRLVLPVRYDSLVLLGENRFKLKQNNVWGLSDAKGVMIINPKFDQLEYLNNGYVIVARDGKFGLLNEQGVSTIPQIYDGLSYDSIHEQYLALKRSTWRTH
jgi:hypothetical protein